MAGDRQPRHAEPAATRPAPAGAPPSFGTGLAPGMGAPTSVLGSLAMRPAEERADVLRDLQRGAGNHSVARMIQHGEGDAPASSEG